MADNPSGEARTPKVCSCQINFLYTLPSTPSPFLIPRCTQTPRDSNFHVIRDEYETLEQVAEALRIAGLESSNLVRLNSKPSCKKAGP